MNDEYRRPADDPRVAQTRQLVLGAARRLLVDEGQEAITPTRLTEITGISRSTIYRHWDDPSTIIFEAAGVETEESRFSPSGDVRLDLSAYLEELRHMLKSLRGTLLATQMESAEHHEVAAESMQRIAAHRRELIGHMLDHPDDFGDEHALIVGPLIYQRFMAREEISDDLIAMVVEAYLQAREGTPD